MTSRAHPADTKMSWPSIPADPHSALPGTVDPALEVVLAEFTARWDRGEAPRVEAYLSRLGSGPSLSSRRVELIYREFCLAGWAGLDPDPDAYLARFPNHAEALERLFRVDGLLGSSGLRLWDGALTEDPLPEVGNGIGPYHLIRELGRGGFARVFLAEQANLDDRLVVVKVSTRLTREPGLLARAGHPNIVQVLWHGEADGGLLQLICMPFLGGASLSAVLESRRRRGVGRGSGRDLLDDLDRVSASGYLPGGSRSLARERIGSLSYPRATAWIVARLAEALDFAYRRGVLHGDVKPSNVLLAADGSPMLLDFNLSVDWRPHEGGTDLPGETAGTLAYMAPERLRSVADPSRPARPSPADRHRADIYSLGVLLLEMLTGRAPDLPEGPGLSLQEMASYYVSSREHGGEMMIRTARKPLSAGLRAILAHCLAPDPADRYKFASEVAEDLDRWRADLPLTFAKDPAGALRLARAARRHRRVLATLAAGLMIGAMVTAIGWQRASVVGRENALSYQEKVYSGAFQYQRALTHRLLTRGNPAEIARGHLDSYDVLDPSNDWRQRERFRDLPPVERDELEVWLLEQALRYAHALGDRPDRAHWQRALASLEPVAGLVPSSPLLDLCRDLRKQLGKPASDPAPSSAAPPRWVNEYLSGVEAELRNRPADALDYYKTVLELRPGSFWANYRAAVVACGWNADEAANRLKTCVDQRPDNAALRLQYAGCLYMAHRDQEAIEPCDKAQRLDPDHAETYFTRSLLRIRLGQFENYTKDLRLYDVLTGRSSGTSSDPLGLDLARAAIGPDDELEGRGAARRSFVAFDPDEAGKRGELGAKLAEVKQYGIALEQFDRVLEMDPGDVLALYDRASLRDLLRVKDADEDFALIVQHPRIEALIRARPKAIQVFHSAVMSLVRQGKFEEAVQVASTGVRLADRYKTMQAESYYALARAHVLLAKTDRAIERDALDNLRWAYAFSRAARSWYTRDPVFKSVRADFGLSPFEPR